MPTNGRHTGLRLAKTFLALVSLFLMSFCALSSLLITLPRYVKLYCRSFLESELECTPRQPDHRSSQGHLGIPLDRRRNPPLFASTWSFAGFSHYVIDEDEEKQWWEQTSLSHPCLDLEEIRKAFAQNQAALKSLREQLEWDDLLR